MTDYVMATSPALITTLGGLSDDPLYATKQVCGMGMRLGIWAWLHNVFLFGLWKVLNPTMVIVRAKVRQGQPVGVSKSV